MIVYIYKDGLCDPAKKIGTARKFGTSKDADEFIKLFVSSCKPESLKRFRIIIANDEVEFYEVDHFILMGDAFGVQATVGRVKEVPVHEVAKDCNHLVQEAEKLKRRMRRQREEQIKRGELSAEQLALYTQQLQEIKQ